MNQLMPFHDQTGFETVACTICRQHDVKPFPWGDHHLNLLKPLAIVQCQRCGLLFMSPRPDGPTRLQLMQGILPATLKDYDKQTANYAAVTRGRTDRFQQRLRQLMALVSLDQTTFPRMLDVGASAGTLVQLAQKQGWHAYGIEPSVGGTQAALVQNQLVLPQAKAEAIPLVGQWFDVVHAHHVFEHLEDPLLAAREAWRVLKPGSLFFIEVPNQFDNVMFRRDRLLRRVPQRGRNIRSIHHLWFFAQKTLGHLLKEAGFEGVQVHHAYSWQARGWRRPFSFLTRVVGQFAGGGDLIYAYGYKSQS